ncbi:MAG: hypothetical protein HRT73_08355 [Flavobacteriales bacterium]|nr:hypothetical protein [Flavobacteriales bacterium]
MSKIATYIKFILPIIFAAYLLNGITPYFYAGSDDSILGSDPDVIKKYSEFKEASKQHIGSFPFRVDLIVPVTSFVGYDVSFEVSKVDAQFKYKLGLHSAILNWREIIVYNTLFFIVYISILILYPSTLPKLRETSNEKEPVDDASIIKPSSSIEEIFNHDIKSSYSSVEKMRSNSIVLLLSGLTLSVLGVFVFYNTVPDYSIREVTDIGTSYFIMSILRPVCMLIFIESIAWFLLRQYRNSMEDYKYLYRIHLKRKNYQICYYLLSEENNNIDANMIVQTLLNEDISGKLLSGETTESLETKKIKEENNTVSKMSSFIKDSNKNL